MAAETPALAPVAEASDAHHAPDALDAVGADAGGAAIDEDWVLADDVPDDLANSENAIATRQLTCLNCDEKIFIGDVVSHSRVCKVAQHSSKLLDETSSTSAAGAQAGTLLWKDNTRSLLKPSLRPWKRVVCVIEADSISLLKAAGESPIATIAVATITKVALCAVKGHKYCFRVRTKDEDVFHTFDAETNDSLNLWLMKFAYVCEDGIVLRYKPVEALAEPALPSGAHALSSASAPVIRTSRADSTSTLAPGAGPRSGAASPELALPRVQAAGYLEKKSDGLNMLFNRWQGRDFVLDGHVLTWSKDGAQLGSLELAETHRVEMGRESRSCFEFHIAVPEGRTYNLRCSDSETRQAWIDALLMARRYAPEFRAAAAAATAAAAAAAGASTGDGKGSGACAAAAGTPVAPATSAAPAAPAEPAAMSKSAPLLTFDDEPAAAPANSAPASSAPANSAPASSAPASSAPANSAPASSAPASSDAASVPASSEPA